VQCEVPIPLESAPLIDRPPLEAGVRRMRIEMGTTLVIEARAPYPAQAGAAVEAAFAAAAEVARRLHPEAPDSDLAALGDAVPGTPVPLSAAAFAVLSFAQRLSRMSDGLFDPCLPTQPGRIGDLELHGGEAPLAIAHRPVEIDCGGIAKGYAVDAAVETLRSAGCSAGLVNAGGDLRVFGALAETLLLRGPGTGYRPVALADAAVAVSEAHASRAPPGHRGYYVRGGAASPRRYAAVRARDCLTADALTKCVLLGPATLSAALLEAFDAASLG